MPNILKTDVKTINGIPKEELESVYKYLSTKVSHKNALDSICNIVSETYDYQKGGLGNNIPDNPIKDISKVILNFDENGKVVSVDLIDASDGKITSHMDSSKIEFHTTINDTKNFTSDTDMSTKYKDYDTLSDLEKLQTKQTELEGQKVISAVKDIPLNSSTLDKYAAAVGKTVDKLDDIDLALIKIADNLTSGDGKVADALNRLSSKCVKFPSSVKKILPVVNVLGTAYEIVTTTIKAKEYYDNGDYENAARVVVDGVVTNIEGWVIATRVA